MRSSLVILYLISVHTSASRIFFELPARAHYALRDSERARVATVPAGAKGELPLPFPQPNGRVPDQGREGSSALLVPCFLIAFGLLALQRPVRSVSGGFADTVALLRVAGHSRGRGTY